MHRDDAVRNLIGCRKVWPPEFSSLMRLKGRIDRLKQSLRGAGGGVEVSSLAIYPERVEAEVYSLIECEAGVEVARVLQAAPFYRVMVHRARIAMRAE